MSHVMLRFSLLAALLVANLPADAATVSVRVADPTGVGVPKILVIVRSLEGKGEVARGLSNAEGIVSTPDVPPGLYEAIATDPYGPWITKVKEFVVGNSSSSVDIVTRFELRNDIPVATSKQPVQVLAHDGTPVKGATILARDLEAKFFFWAESDDRGRAVVTLPLDGAEVVTIYNQQVLARKIDLKSQLSECYSRCNDDEKKENRKTLRELTVRFP